MTFGDDSATTQAFDGPHDVATPMAAPRWQGRPSPLRAATTALPWLVVQLPLAVAGIIIAALLLPATTPATGLFVAAAIVAPLSLLALPFRLWSQARTREILVGDGRLRLVDPDGDALLPLDRIARIERRDHPDGTATLTLFAGGVSQNRLVLPGIADPDAAMAALSAHGPATDQVAIWPRPPVWHADPAAALVPALQPGERLVWYGRPRALASVREIALEFAPFTALALPITALLGWMLPLDLMASGHATPLRLGGFVFLLVGLSIVGPALYVAAILPLVTLWRALTSAVAVTDRRVIIAQGWRRIATTSLFPDDIRSAMTSSIRDDGHATLRINPRRTPALPGSVPAFHGVVDAATGEAAIDALLARP